MTALIDACAAKIDSHISADPQKMMTYAEYLSAVSALKSLVASRASNLSSNSEVNVAGLTVSDVGWTAGGADWAAPTSSQAVTINATVSGGTGVSAVYAHVGEGITGPFIKCQLLDDGQNGDGAAGDGIVGVVLPGRTSGARVRFYIEAVASNTAGTRTYGPAGAAHDVLTWVVQ